jgi:hypothetical protein
VLRYRDSASRQPIGRQEDLAPRQPGGGEVAPADAVVPLGRGAAAGGDEAAQLAPAAPVPRQGNDAPAGGGHRGSVRAGVGGSIRRGAVLQHELGAGDQLQPPLSGLAMRAHQPRHRTFVRHRQRAVAQRMGPLHQLLGMRGADLEAEVAAAVQLGVGGQRRADGR